MTDIAPEQKTSMVSVTLNGRSVELDSSKVLIDAVEDAGEYIPRFCYHPRMSAVGMCRMCLVEVDTGRGPGLQPTCMIKASPDMVIDTESEVTKAAQDGVLELLLINHPLDCPICDKGGECPLQDQTMAYGPGESRFIEEKRHFEKPIPISDNVYLDRERCILCDRCTRFADEVAGDPLIHFMDRGNATQVNTFPDAPFSSYFSGNVVQICPVGALTAKPYRFKARPWDLAEVETTFPNAMGDRVTIQSSQNKVLRYQGVDSDAVNWGWLADRDRFSFEAAQSEQRIVDPLVRGGGLNKPDPDGDQLVATTWYQALDRASNLIASVHRTSGPGAIAVLGGASMTNESQYAWARLAKGVLGTDNVDAQLNNGIPAEVVAALPRATINQACAPGGTTILLAADPKEEFGTLYLRLRHAAKNDRTRLIELTPTRTGLSQLAAHSVRVRPGDIGAVAAALVAGNTDTEVGGVSAEQLADVAAALRDGPVTVVVGRTSIAEDVASTVDAIAALNGLDGVSFLPVLRDGNAAGAVDLGLAPGLLPGRTTLESSSDYWKGVWGGIPAARGLDAAGVLDAAANGRIELMILLGSDPLSAFPDVALAERGMAGVRHVIAIDSFANPSIGRADVVLPPTMFGETTGTHTNIEGRITSVDAKVTAAGTAREDWMIAAELASMLSNDLGIDSVDDITAEIASNSAAHAAATPTAIRAHLDGVVVGPGDAKLEVRAPVQPTPIDAYSFRLVVDRTMFDHGVRNANTPALADLADPAAIRINPSDAARLGAEAGTAVRVSSATGSLEAPVTVTADVPVGTAAMAVEHEGADPRRLIDMGQPVTEVRIENL